MSGNAGRSPDAVWRRVERVGAFVPVGRRVRIDGVDVEIVKTYADCSLTAMFYRAPPRIHAWAVGPAEIVGGANEAELGGLHVTEYPPVLPERASIGIILSRDLRPLDGNAIDIPVDRTRTARFDRLLAEELAPIELAGTRIRLIDLTVGLIRGVAELRIDATDEEILAVQFGQAPFRPRDMAGPGPARLWRDWHPPRELAGQGLVTHPPPRERPPDWRARSLPDREPLATGREGRRGPSSERRRIQPILSFDAPSGSSQAIELDLLQIWTYRFAGAQTSIPSPREKHSVGLEGTTLEGSGCRVELLEWAPVGPNGFRLTARCDPPDAWPDLRILQGQTSASLWCNPPHEGELSAVLPLSFGVLFDRPTVEIALRMVARRVEPLTLVPRLTRAGST